MADTVHVPGFKKPLPKWGVAAGLGAVAVAVYFYYRKQSSSSASGSAAAAAAGGQYPPDGTVGNPADPYSTDPATGQTYGNEAAGQGSFGAFSSGAGGDQYPWDGTYNNPSDPYSMDTSTGTTYGNEGNTSGTGTGSGVPGPPFSTNQAWSAYALQQLTTNDPNLDPGALADAIGLYLAGQPVDTSQQTYIYEAQAVAGLPPVAGPNNYPPQIRLNGNKGPGPTGQVKVPDLKGKTVNQAQNALRSAKLTFNTSESPDKRGYDRIVTGTNPAAGTSVPQGTHVGISWHYVKAK